MRKEKGKASKGARTPERGRRVRVFSTGEERKPSARRRRGEEERQTFLEKKKILWK